MGLGMIKDVGKMAYLVLAFGVIILSALLMGFVMEASAETAIYEFYDADYARQADNFPFRLTNLNGQQVGRIDLNLYMVDVSPSEDWDTGTMYLKMYEASDASCTGLTQIATSSSVDISNFTTYSTSVGNFYTRDNLLYHSFYFSTLPVPSTGHVFIEVKIDYTYDGAAKSVIRVEQTDDEAPIPNNRVYTFGAGTCNMAYYDESIAIGVYGYEVESDVYVIDYEPQDFFVQIGSSQLYLRNKDCFNGDTCKIKLEYPYEMVGDTITLYETNSTGTATGTAIATTTLPNSLLLLTELSLSDQSVGTIKYYKAWNSDTLEFSNVARVTWYDESEYLDSEYDLDNACSDMASTTWEFWNPTTWAGGMGYALECSFRKVLYWGFTPKPSTYLKLENAKEDIAKEFPFNIFAGINAVVDVASSSATSTMNIPIMFIDTDTNIATMTLSNAGIQTNYPTLWEKFMLMQTIVFYLAGFGVVVVLGLKILKMDFGNKQNGN